ncbi:MAG: hypothetical protein RIR00_1475 [Pseudomonadota bacterium]|jgi:phasin family protein
MSNPNFEQIAAAQKANAEVLTSLVRIAFNGVERLAALNLAATRDFFDTTVASTQQVLGAKDATEIAKLQATLSQPGLTKALDYSRSVYDLVANLQKELTGVVEGQYQAFTKNAASAIDKTSAQAPVGGDIFAATMKSLLDATTKAYENLNGVAKQVTSIAEANVQAATTAAASAAGVAKKK